MYGHKKSSDICNLLVTHFQSGDTYGFSIDQLVRFYLDTCASLEDDRLQKNLLNELTEKFVALEKRTDSLLKNTLPETVADEIKYKGRFLPRSYQCTILFTDFVGFTKLAEQINKEVLIGLLDIIFKGFDDLILTYHGTKIKTIGDAYMAVFGAPIEYKNHALMAVKAGLSLQDFIANFNNEHNHCFQMRIGIHTGEVMAGVVGKERMQFDIFGDDVNIASRFESSGMAGHINISHTTYSLIKDYFECIERGSITLKNKADMKAYFVIKAL